MWLLEHLQEKQLKEVESGFGSCTLCLREAESWTISSSCEMLAPTDQEGQGDWPLALGFPEVCLNLVVDPREVTHLPRGLGLGAVDGLGFRAEEGLAWLPWCPCSN